MKSFFLHVFVILLFSFPALAAEAVSDPFASAQPKAVPAAVLPTPAPEPVKSSKPTQRYEQPWRLPNGIEEYYMLLALDTGNRQWCERMSPAAQLRKVDARVGVQVISWRDTCLIEVAVKTQNKELCRFVRGVYVDALNGKEFGNDYCLSYIQRASSQRRSEALHWLQRDPYKPLLINAPGILRSLGFSEDDLVDKHQQGLYQVIVKSTWEQFLLQRMLGQYSNSQRQEGDQARYDKLVKRSLSLPEFSTVSPPVDRFLQYTGTAVKLPANCYENPTAEFSCRMLQCLSNKDLITCRSLSQTKEIMDLHTLFSKKCMEETKVNAEQFCKAQVEDPFNKIFNGPPETFIPYLAR
jgi:hypothetical protein